MAKKRVFSGIKPSGDLHLGNYLGAIRNWVLEQEQNDNIFCVVDMHAVTVPQDPRELHKRTRDIAKLYIASGLDTGLDWQFSSSRISMNTQNLAWIV